MVSIRYYNMTQKNIFYAKTAIPPRDLPLSPSKTILNIVNHPVNPTSPLFENLVRGSAPHKQTHTNPERGDVHYGILERFCS